MPYPNLPALPQPQSRPSRPPSRPGLFSALAGHFPAGYPAPTGMRRPGKPVAPPGEASSTVTLPPLAVVALNRMAFGPRPGDIAAFNALGGTDTARLTAYVDQQLSPTSISDTDCDNRIAAATYQTLNKTATQLFQDHHLADPPTWEQRIQPALETELATWMRAVYSKRQLLESMVHFWHNHFSMYAYEFLEGPMWVQVDRDVIRANALGNFRAMLGGIARSQSMLVYLDNFINFADSGVGYSNENFARECLELHCLGATVSYGNTPRNLVPTDGNGVPLGYCQEDVQDLARALTGWTFDIDYIPGQAGTTGQFVYRNDLHSTEAKILLGTQMASGRTAQVDGNQALDILVQHPACGKFIAKKLCRRLVGDFPPQSLVDSAAALFTSQWQAPDQLKQVVRHILLSNEFRTTWGEKIKRPFEIAVSALRASSAELRFYYQIPYPPDYNTWHVDMMDTSGLHYLYEMGNQILFGWHPPNGHPDIRGAWQASSPRVACWRLVNWLVETQQANGTWRLNVIGQTPSGVRSANEIVDFWIDRIYGRALSAFDRDQLVDFMASGHNADLDLPLDTDDATQDRLRSLVALMFMSPEFLWR
ncbi:MAG: DUF1800 domain-containing protein [Thermoanaerobaculia bacterium]